MIGSGESDDEIGGIQRGRGKIYGREICGDEQDDASEDDSELDDDDG